MHIRQATGADREALLRMAVSFVDQTAYHEALRGATPETLAAIVDGALELGAAGLVLLAEDQGRVCGMLAMARVLNPIMDRWFWDELVWWVDPTHRNARIGPALLSAAEYHARSSDLTLIKLVAPAGSRVGTFLQRRGYVPIETCFIKELGDDGLVRDGAHEESEPGDVDRHARAGADARRHR